MRERTEWRAALSAMAAVSGVGLASGRALTLFFAQTKDAAWSGVLTACALFGILTGFIASGGTANAWHARGLETFVEALRLLLAALASAFLLSKIGEMGALTLPMRHGYLFGAAFGLLAAVALGWLDVNALLGLLTTLGLAAFYIASALDTRPVRVHLRGETAFLLAGSMPAALALATAYAALNACAAGWGLRAVRTGTVRPWALGLRCALLMSMVLAPGMAALSRGGDALLVQPMPWVVQSARWGIVGFWLCAGLTALCATASLSAALGTLTARLATERRAMAVYMLIVALAVFGMLSFDRF